MGTDDPFKDKNMTLFFKQITWKKEWSPLNKRIMTLGCELLENNAHPRCKGHPFHTVACTEVSIIFLILPVVYFPYINLLFLLLMVLNNSI